MSFTVKRFWFFRHPYGLCFMFIETYAYVIYNMQYIYIYIYIYIYLYIYIYIYMYIYIYGRIMWGQETHRVLKCQQISLFFLI